MSMKRDSNVITVDFSARKAAKPVQQKIPAEPIESVVGDLIMDALNGPDEWPEDLTPKEKTERLKEDLEFIIQSNEFNK